MPDKEELQRKIERKLVETIDDDSLTPQELEELEQKIDTLRRLAAGD